MSRRRTAGDDAGVTMMDLLVSMSIMLVVGTIVTAGLIQLYRLTARTQTVADAQSQLHVALGRLDRQVRYAAGITVVSPSSVTVEVVQPGADRCYDTRLTGGVLQQRWKVVGGGYGGWTSLASGVTGATFTYLAPTDANDHQRLQVRLTAQAVGAVTATQDATVTFTALNTTRATSGTAC